MSVIVRLKVKEFAEKKGVANPFVLASVTGINYATCYALWQGRQQRIDLKTLGMLCEALGSTPNDLLVLEKSSHRSESKGSKEKRALIESLLKGVEEPERRVASRKSKKKII